ncbi:phytanoyl-CoA dioxygenase family protein [Leptothoe sp. EHU-05/26/07-4]
MQQYEKEGVLFLPEYLSQEEVALLKAEIVKLPEDLPGRVFEKDSQTVRALHGSHQHSYLLKRLVRHPLLLEPAQQILKEQVYLYQFKINMKAAFSGDAWPWHQDYMFWYGEDGLLTPAVISAAIFIDDIDQFNGPLFFIPGSHTDGVINVGARAQTNEEEDWIANVSADLKYCVGEDLIASMVQKNGMIAPTGPKGSVVFFHGNVVHASASNISPYDRRLILITYSSISNTPTCKDNPRPDFLVSREYQPLEMLENETLLEMSLA